MESGYLACQISGQLTNPRPHSARMEIMARANILTSLALKGGSLEGLVKNNIEASFAAFNDDERDGHDDSGSRCFVDDVAVSSLHMERSIP